MVTRRTAQRLGRSLELYCHDEERLCRSWVSHQPFKETMLMKRGIVLVLVALTIAGMMAISQPAAA
jgi:hypothetical protein